MFDLIKWDTIYFLSKIRLYRKIIGGKWYKVTPGFNEVYWINRKPLYNEMVLSVENWLLYGRVFIYF